ncbi:MAG: PAS domain-containing protein [bacterium]|nr:PAS domain-containing protein [bacterium]
MRTYLTRIPFLAGRISSEARETLDGQVLRALAPVSGGLAIAFSLFAVLNLLDDLSPRATTAIVGGDLGSVGCFLLLYIALKRRMIPARRANVLALGVVALSLANILVVIGLAREPLYLSYLAIVAVACGSILLSLRWLLAALGLAAVSSAPLAWRMLSSESLFHYGVLLVAASALAVIVLVARRSDALATHRALASAKRETARRRETEASLLDSERRMEFAIAGSQGGWWDISMDPDAPETLPDAITLDPTVKAFIGFEDHEFPGSLREWRSRILPADLERHSAAVAEHLAGKTPLLEVEYRIRHRKGGVRWIYSRGRIQRDENGNPTRWSGIDWDITDSKQTEDRLNLLTRAVEQSPSLVIITDIEGTIEYVNPKFTRTTGYSAEEAIGKKPSFLKSDQTAPDTHRELWETIAAGREWQGEFRNTKKDGSAFWVISSISPIKSATGVTQHYLAVQEDVTERKKVEARLAQAQNLESVGQLVSGVAHDFNNLLTAVIGFAELGLRQAAEGMPLHRELMEIKKAGLSASDLTRQLLAFSRRQMLEPRVLNLNDVVTDVEQLLKRTINEDIHVELTLDPDLGATRVDPAQVSQILVNLAVNARDAMPEGGRLTIETAEVELDGDHAFGTAVPDPGPYVLLAVSDTGEGIDEQTQERVFEPFFTTKPRGQGTGLGLSTVYGVVKQSGGFISLYSEPGIGTSFKVYFPRVEATVEARTAQAATEARGGGETILVVEDNDGVRKVAARTLKNRGYRVFSCAEAQEAVRIFGEQEIDLLLTDIVMPGTNGATLAQDLKGKRPSLQVLLMSGYTERSVLDAHEMGFDTFFLHKPFRLDDLLTKVGRCLDSRS